MLRIFLVIAAGALVLAILHVIAPVKPATTAEMPLVYCHSQGGVVKDGKCVKKEGAR